MYNYKYNGKELQETVFTDFGSRQYMNDLGRWFSPDALSEEFSDWSPYNYGFNNPMRFIDPDGNAPEDTVDDEDCCSNLKGFAFTMADNIMGTNFRNNYAVDSKDYKKGVNFGHGASLVLTALMATDGAASIGGGTTGLALSGGAASTGIGAPAGALGATLSGGAIAKGTIELAGAGVILNNTMKNMQSDKKSNSSSNNKSSPSNKVEKSKTTTPVGKEGKYTKTTEVRPSKQTPGQARAEYTRIKNKDGKVIRTYKDSYDRANKFQHRKPLTGGPEGRPSN